MRAGMDCPAISHRDHKNVNTLGYSLTECLDSHGTVRPPAIAEKKGGGKIETYQRKSVSAGSMERIFHLLRPFSAS